MEYNYPKFTPEMKKTHTILIPNMAITQFRLLEYALRYDGYKCEILGNCGSAVAQLGLKYVHNIMPEAVRWALLLWRRPNRATVSAHQAGNVRADDLHAHLFFKGAEHGFIIKGTALHHDLAAQLFRTGCADDLVQCVLNR